MNPRKKQIIEQRGAEVAKAGRMFFDAIFGDTDDFVRKLEAEADEDGVIDVEGHETKDR